jgi:hypothetical protein
VEDGHYKACLTELASARGFKPANSLGIETNADYEQDWSSVGFAYWNGVDLTVNECARDAIRGTGQANLAGEHICGSHRYDAQRHLSA